MTTPASPVLDVPRVLLFGARGAGKSALIGALLQASATQPESLRGEVEVEPVSADLPGLRDATYSGNLQPAGSELASFTVRLRPLRQRGRPPAEPLTVVLDDCDGRAAEALMEHPEPITQRAPGSPLARAVVETDAIVLLVNASSEPEELEEAFAEFRKFLDVVQRANTDARTVGGFPVSLVLTKCDQLEQPGDSLRMWEARVKDREDAASKAFEQYLKEAVAEDGAPAPFLGFGSLHFDVFSVAIHPPALAGRPARDRPHGVAELFRDCFAAASAHHERAGWSETRLWWTVRLALSGLAFLLLLLGLIALFPPETGGPDLAARVDDYRAHEPPAAERLADGDRPKNQKALQRLANDRAFGSLSADRKAFVESRLKEIEDYQDYRRKLASAFAPASARDRPELAKVGETLRTDLALPPQYSWGDTAAAELRDKWLADITAIEAAEQVLVDKYREYDRAGTVLMLKRRFDAGWFQELNALLAAAEKPPFPLNDPLPGSAAIDRPRGEAVTYRVPYEFDEVYKARRYWEQTRDRLAHLRDLADAVGLTTAPDRPTAVLTLPEPGEADSAGLAAARLAELRRAYPRQSDGYPEWETRRFADPARRDIAARLRASFAAGRRHVQRLFDATDTVKGWAALGAALAEPKYRAWGELLHLLARLQDPAAPDPVAELAAFLRDLDTKTFPLDLRGFDLTIPLDLKFDRVEPADPFTITITHADQTTEVAKFTVGKPTTRGTTAVYPLTSAGDTKLAYRPGDALRAELPVKVGARDLKLVWAAGASNTFQFDRLTREPRLTTPDGGTEPAPGVALTPAAGSLPAFPVLFPAPR